MCEGESDLVYACSVLGRLLQSLLDMSVVRGRERSSVCVYAVCVGWVVAINIGYEFCAREGAFFCVCVCSMLGRLLLSPLGFSRVRGRK